MGKIEIVKSSRELLVSPQVIRHLPTGCSWWSKYIYHFSHVTNVAAILNDGLLRSRKQVEDIKNETLNDNASGDVIDGTEDEYKDHVRFYFRPLTPTQYHNEGIRAQNEITELRAHCPIPIFLLFDTEMLDEPNVFFSYESLASHYDVPLQQGVHKLAKAPFKYIYHNSSTYNLDGNKIRKHRQAEIVVKDQCSLIYLKKIVCRTKPESDTLKSLLNLSAYTLFSDKICVIGDEGFDTKDKSTIFNSNYLEIIEVQQTKTELYILFNKPDRSQRKVELYWLNRNDEVICEFVRDNYKLGGKGISFNLFDNLKTHDFVKLQIKLDGTIIYCNKFSI